MKQVLQSYRTGELWLAEVPAPACAPGGVLVRTHASVVSLGTEKAMLDLAKKSLLGKARARPDLVSRVIQRVRTEGVAAALRKVKSQLDEPISLGYSAAGEVVETGADAGGLQAGDRVSVAGAGYAAHAEFNFVPRNLCARIPDGVGYENAAFATIGAIALQGVRQTQPQLGERIVVIGLGLVGLLTVQLLRANGCAVLGVDADAERVAFAAGMFGADAEAGGAAFATTADAAQANADFTAGHGADAVIIAAATASNEPVASAGELCRAKGRVVVVGMVGMDVPRDVYYAKELDLRLSMSYGPGRYDPEYEERGRDYPFAYVRFTEQRNMEAFLDLVRQGRVAPGELVSHRFAFEQALDAYALLDGRSAAKSAPRPLGILLEYGAETPPERTLPQREAAPASRDQIGIGMIGAGNFARGVLLPKLARQPSARMVAVCTQRGNTTQAVAEQFKFETATTDGTAVLENDDVNAVFVATRHDSHAALAAEALRAGKHVFVEKPLCIDEADLETLGEAVQEAGDACLMVGFNRRFSPHADAVRSAFQGRGAPMAVSYRVNAGSVDPQHWTQDPAIGGGRLLGEVCHFVDFCTSLIGCEPVAVTANSIATDRADMVAEDSVVVTIAYADGSLATIQYLAEGHRLLAKERCEVFADGRSAVIEDFRRTRFYGGGRNLRGKQDKGFDEELRRFLAVCKDGGLWPILWPEIVATHRVCFAALRSLRGKYTVTLGDIAA